MYTYVGDFENCPKLDTLLKKLGPNVLDGVELKFPFPWCKKAKIDDR
jgi:tRNA G46 methylase TrmB